MLSALASAPDCTGDRCPFWPDVLRGLYSPRPSSASAPVSLHARPVHQAWCSTHHASWEGWQHEKAPVSLHAGPAHQAWCFTHHASCEGWQHEKAPASLHARLGHQACRITSSRLHIGKALVSLHGAHGATHSACCRSWRHQKGCIEVVVVVGGLSAGGDTARL